MKSTILIAHEYGAPDVLEYTQQTLQPLALGNARIQVKAAGINPIDARRMTGELNMQPCHKPSALNTQASLLRLMKLNIYGKWAMKSSAQAVHLLMRA